MRPERISDAMAQKLLKAGVCVFDLITKERIFSICEVVGLEDFGGEYFGSETQKAIRRKNYIVAALVRDGYIRKSIRSDARMFRVLRLPDVDMQRLTPPLTSLA